MRGISSALKKEANFRIHIVATFAIFAFLIWSRLPAIWWALTALLVGVILAAELFNTALEKALDALHPQHDPLIGYAKDCAAGAVLILSLAALGILAAMLLQL